MKNKAMQQNYFIITWQPSIKMNDSNNSIGVLRFLVYDLSKISWSKISEPIKIF